MDLHSFLNWTYNAGPIKLVTWEVLYVIVLLLVLSRILDAALFQPVMKVLDERKRVLDEARKAQELSLATLEERTRKYALEVAAARRDAQQRLEAARREAEALGKVQTDEAAHTAQGQVAIARDIVERATRQAETELRGKVGEMARLIAARVLDRDVA